MSFKEFDMTEYYTVLEEYKNEDKYKVIRSYGSEDNYNKFIEKCISNETAIANETLKVDM